MKKGKKSLIILVSLLLIVGGVFFFLHDDADLEKIEKEQIKSAEISKEKMNNDLDDSFGEEENLDTNLVHP